MGTNVIGQSEHFVELGDESHVEITFTGNTILRGADLNANELQLQVTGGAFDQSDDHSYEPAFSTARQPNDRITAYLAGTLVWGCEPSGVCAEGGTGGAGGGGAGGAAGGGGGPAEGGASGEGGAPDAAGGASGEGGSGGAG